MISVVINLYRYLSDFVTYLCAPSQIECHPANNTPCPGCTLPTTIDDGIATDLRNVIIGNGESNGLEIKRSEWTEQHFEFSKTLTYGLVQKKGGPCGLLAVVQAYVLKSLLYGANPETLNKNGSLRPTPEACNNALLDALASILWKIGEKKHAVIVVPSNQNESNSNIVQAGFINNLTLRHFTKHDDLISFMKNVYTHHLKDDYICLEFLFSAVLTRGIENVKEDMHENSLISIKPNQSECYQEMVNLLLFGKAVGNVTNDSERLKGPTKTSEIGFLTCDKWNVTEVGSYLKNPAYDIWVLLIGFHYTVLFLTKNAPKEVCTGFIYNTLSIREETIPFTRLLQGGYNIVPNSSTSEDLIKCLRTKWPENSETSEISTY